MRNWMGKNPMKACWPTAENTHTHTLSRIALAANPTAVLGWFQH